MGALLFTLQTAKFAPWRLCSQERVIGKTDWVVGTVLSKDFDAYPLERLPQQSRLQLFLWTTRRNWLKVFWNLAYLCSASSASSLGTTALDCFLSSSTFTSQDQGGTLYVSPLRVMHSIPHTRQEWWRALSVIGIKLSVGLRVCDRLPYDLPLKWRRFLTLHLPQQCCSWTFPLLKPSGKLKRARTGTMNQIMAASDNKSFAQ